MSFERGKGCPSRSELEALSKGDLSEDLSQTLEIHLTTCDQCCARLDQIGSGFLQELDPASSLAESIVATSSPRSIPDKLGSYEVLGEIARGGMGVVLRAHDPDLQRVVAIKGLAPDLASNPNWNEGFLREARAAAKLEHDNVMPIYAVEIEGDLPYLAMPYVETGSLQDFLDGSEELPMEELIRIGCGISKALEAAHANNPLSPPPMMLSTTSRQKQIPSS
jgi:serine/threonine protein kinase